MSGFVLNIDQKLINQLTQADALVKQLGVTSERTRDQFNKAFSDMATIGVDGLIKRLTEAQTKIAELGGSMSTGNGLGTISTQATQSSDAINRLIQTLTQLSSTLATSQQQQPLLKITEQDLGAGRMKAIKKAQMDEMVAQQQAASQMQIQIIKGEVATQIETLKSGYAVQIQEAKNAGAKKVGLAKVEAANIAASTQKQTNQVRVNARLEIAAFKDRQQALTNYHKAMAMSEQGVMSRQTKLARLSSVLKDLQREENNYGKEIERVKAKMAELREEQGLIKKVGNSLADMLKKIFAFNTIKNFVTKLMTVRGEYEQQHRAMQVLLQDYNKANIIWNKTVQLAVRSPYTIQQLTSYTKQLAAYRIESDKLYDTTKRLADISVGLGVDMQRIILAYGQVRAANFLRGTELRQFTEAGIPMLDELAKYFSAVEHTTVTAAQVFDRISKRQVLFTDVDAVIQKMTDAGGIFYNMQEEMANTLAGMSSNLKDKVYLMFNEIGAETQGLLSSMLKLLGWLTENWRVLATVLEILLLPAVTKMVFGFIRSIKQMKLMRVTSLRASGGLVKLASTWKGLASLMLTTPIGLMITLVLSLGAAMYELNNRTKAMNAELDKMSANTQKQITNLEEQKQKVEENNRIIKDSENATNLTEEAETKLAEARAENTRILDELKKRHPDFYKNIIQQKNGTVELTGAIEEQNKQLAKQAVFANLVKGSWFSQSLIKNSELFTKRVAEVQRNLDESIAEYEAERANVQIKENLGEISKTDSKTEISRIDAKIKSLNAVKERLNNLNAETMTSLTELSRPISGKRSYSEQQYYAILDAAQTAYANLEDVKKIMAQDLREMSAGGVSQEDMTKYIHDSLSPLIADTDLLSLIESELNNYFLEVKAIDVPLNFNFNIPPEEIDQWQKNYNKAITEAISEINKDLEDSDKVYFKEITVGTSVANSRDKLIKDAQEAYSQQTDLLKRVRKKAIENNGSLIGTAYEGYSIKNIEAQIELQKKILDFFEAPYTKGKGKDDKENKVLSKRISLLKELYQSYEKLKAKYGDTEALGILRESYSANLEETFGDSLSFDNLTFDNVKEGLKNALETLRPLAQKEGKEAQNTLNKEISGVNVEIGFENVDKSNKQLKQQVDSLFAQFDLSRELEKLGLSEDLMKSLFDVEYLDLASLNAKLEELKPQFKGGEMENEYEQYVERINKLSKKEQEQQAKDFVKFLTKKLNETTVLMQKSGGYITYAQELFNEGKITAEQYSEVVNEVIREANEGISKANLNLFKDSDTYIKAMGSLAGYTADELKNLRESLQKIVADNSKAFSADEINAYYDAIARITEQEQKLRKPWEKTGFGEIKYLNEQYKERKRLIKEESRLEQNKQTLIQQRTNLEQELADAAETGEDTDWITEQLNSVIEGLGIVDSKIKKNAAALAMVNGNIDKISNGLGEVWDKAAIGVAQVNNIAQGIKDSFNEIKDVAASFGVDTENESWTKAGIVIESFANATENASGMLTSLVNGDIGGTLKGLVGFVGSIIKGFNQFHDAKYDAIIKTEQKNVEKLAKAYDKLEKKIKDAMDVTQLQESSNAARENLEKQIEATQNMINAEEDKKDTDEEAVEEYKTNLDELNEKLKELEAERVKTLGGFGDIDAMKSATEEFVDAWMEAYKETGDGLDALEGKFNEFLENTIKKQIVMRGANNILKGLYENYDAMFSEDSAGGAMLTPDEADAIRKLWEQSKQQLNDYLLNISKSLGVTTGEADGELSGLQAGIQGITESQAEILTTYANSCRFFLSSINTTLSDFATKVFDTEGDSNPILSQLRIVAQQTTAINSLLSSLTKGGHTEGGLGLKVFIN